MRPFQTLVCERGSQCPPPVGATVGGVPGELPLALGLGAAVGGVPGELPLALGLGAAIGGFPGKLGLGAAVGGVPDYQENCP